MLCFAVYSIVQLRCLTNYSSKIDMLMGKVVLLLFRCTCWKQLQSHHLGIYCIKLLCVCARVDMENRRREEFGVAVAHFFFPLSSVFPLSLRRCQSPWGRISAAAIGRPRLSKYTFNFLRLCRLALFSFSLCCAGSPGPWVGESLWVLASGSGLLKKKKQVIYWEK